MAEVFRVDPRSSVVANAEIEEIKWVDPRLQNASFSRHFVLPLCRSYRGSERLRQNTPIFQSKNLVLCGTAQAPRNSTALAMLIFSASPSRSMDHSNTNHFSL
ncbi:MAG TPA: hypothetical protein VE641_07555, partial [Chthoniobacterales bacterium]|nr:hypothetical protein [Chthoniobacterales bacterium]